MKTCGRCRMAKPRSEFNRNGSKKDGLQDKCRPCHRADVAEKLRVKRALALYLMGNTCAHCGVFLIGKWQAHHKTPRAKSGRVCINWNWSWGRIERELLDDMELICRDCHHSVQDGYHFNPAAATKAKRNRQEL